MNDKPKPPEGYETWMDAVLSNEGADESFHKYLAWAREDAAELRADAAKWKEYQAEMTKIECENCGAPLVWHSLPTKPPHVFTGFLYCADGDCDPYPVAWGEDEADAMAKIRCDGCGGAGLTYDEKQGCDDACIFCLGTGSND